MDSNQFAILYQNNTNNKTLCQTSLLLHYLVMGLIRYLLFHIYFKVFNRSLECGFEGNTNFNNIFMRCIFQLTLFCGTNNWQNSTGSCIRIATSL
jgi:hypothetical protein